MRYRFGCYELDEEAGELRRDGRPVAIQPKPFEVLRLLLRERSRVVAADELLESLWPGVAVTQASLTRAVSLARRAISEPSRGALIRSHSRRGYRFVGPVVALDRTDPPEPAALPRADGPTATAPAAPDADPGDATPGPVAAFVGRSDDRARLREAWRAAVTGAGGIALVTGPPGIGKTTLSQVFCGEVRASGGRVVSQRCREDAPDLWPWARVLRALTEGASAAEVRDATSMPEELALLLPPAPSASAAAVDAAPSTDLSPEQRRFRLFETVAGRLIEASRRRPLLIFLDDIQWAGTASLRLLEHLSYEIAGEPLLVLATIRDALRPADHPLERTLPVLHRQPRSVSLPLQRFTRAELEALVEKLLGRLPPPPLTDELQARTEGIPLFLREAIRLLAERAAREPLQPDRHHPVSIPGRALDLIHRPLAALSGGCADLIAAAAVLGREFTLTEVAAVADTSRDRALDPLDEAERAGVVEPVSEAPGTWRFSHALFREAVLERLTAGQRARLHARAAGEIERRHTRDPDSVIARLAYHHHAAIAVGDPERAHACAWRAAERASRLLAHEEAAIHYEQAVSALEHFDTVDPSRRLEALLALGDAHRLSGHRTRRREVFARAMDEAHRLDRAVDVARAAIGFCDLSEWAPRDDEAATRVREALALVPEDARVERAALLTRSAYLSMREALDSSSQVARQALDLARSVGEPLALQDAIYALFFRLAGPDAFEERAQLADEALAAVRAGGAADSSLIACLDMTCQAVAVGDRALAQLWRSRAEEVAGPSPHTARVWHMKLCDAGLAILEGRFEEGARLAEESLRLGQRIAHPYARGVDRSLRVWLARERGDHDEVLRILPPTLPIRIGPQQWVQAIVARTLVALGRRSEARELYDDLVQGGIGAIPRNIRWHCTIAELAYLCSELRDGDGAERLIETLTPVAHHHAVLPLPTFYAGPFTRCLAHLRWTVGELDEADALFEEADAAVSGLDALPVRARLCVERGGLDLHLGRRERGRERLAEGRALAARLGMTEVVTQAEAAG